MCSKERPTGNARPTRPAPAETKPDGSKMITPSGSPQGPADLESQPSQQGLVVPRGATRKVLQPLAILAVQVRDPLGAFAIEIRAKAFHVHHGMAALLRTAQAGRVRLKKGHRAIQQAVGQLRSHLASAGHLQLPYLKTGPRSAPSSKREQPSESKESLAMKRLGLRQQRSDNRMRASCP